MGERNITEKKSDRLSIDNLKIHSSVKFHEDKSNNSKKSTLQKSTMGKGDSTDRVSRTVPKNVGVRLEPSLSEKLIKKEAVADELEDNLQNLRIDFEDKLQFSESVKKELSRREIQLLQSVDTIEAYLKKICSLKCEADDMFKRLNSRSEELEAELLDLSEEYEKDFKQNENRLNTFKTIKKAKTCLDEIVIDLPNYSSSKGLVEYFLVLKLLRNDLIEEDKKYLEEVLIRTDQENVSESIRSHPFSILAKRNAIHDLKSKLKDIRSQNIDLKQQIEDAASIKVKEDLTYYELKRWINKVYNSIDDILPPQPDESKGTTLNQLQKILDFVERGTQIAERLKQTTSRKVIV